MTVIVKYYDNDIAKGLLIEGKTYVRAADLVNGLGLFYDWMPGPPHIMTVTGTIPGTVPSGMDNLGQGLNNIHITENFNLKEFQCTCCKRVMLDPELVGRLQMMRDELGAAITVNSGYRCAAHNRDVGGAKDSQHLYGKAADITAKDLPRLALLAEEYFSNQGLGLYKNYVHVDVRGSRAWWKG